MPAERRNVEVLINDIKNHIKNTYKSKKTTNISPVGAESPLPSGYYWSAKIQDPQALSNGRREYFLSLNPGYYDVATIPVGDNLALANGGAFTQVKLDNKSHLSVTPKFEKNEPSCGFIICQRGPYTNQDTPENQRGGWVPSSLPDGLNYGRMSVPVYTHSGSRYDRYAKNGYLLRDNGWYPSPNSTWWTNASPIGALNFSGVRVPVLPSINGPDVSIVYGVKSDPAYVYITLVDMLGRETNPSPMLTIDSNGGDGCCIKFARTFQVPMGTCGYYVYAGYSPETMSRQPVFNHVGKTPKYLWPIHLQTFSLHTIVDTGIKPVVPGVNGVASVLNSVQKQLADNKKVVTYNADSYDLYCPIILPYDPATFGKYIGGNRRCWFTQRANYIDGRPLQTDIPMVYCQSQRDRFLDAVFTSQYAYAGVTFSDFSGGQSFSNHFERVNFWLSAPESVGFLVDESCSKQWGDHTASETRVHGCTFYATIPVQVEGNQTAKIRFTDMCAFLASGITSYKADTSALYICSPNQFGFDNLEGIGGEFRSIICVAAASGAAKIVLNDLFIDAGCPVYFTFSSYSGGTIYLTGGERINAHSQEWARLVEAPSCLNANLVSNGIYISGNTSSISFALNKLTLNIDFPVAEIVTPTTEWWTSKGLPLDGFTKNRRNSYVFGYVDVPDSISNTPIIGV